MLGRAQGVTVTDESAGGSGLRIALESVFISPETLNTLVESDFCPHKLELIQGQISLEAMQLYATHFTSLLEERWPRFPNSRSVNYIFAGIEPYTLRSLVNPFRVERVSDMFEQFQNHSTASLVMMINLQTFQGSPVSAKTAATNRSHNLGSSKPRKLIQ